MTKIEGLPAEGVDEIDKITEDGVILATTYSSWSARKWPQHNLDISPPFRVMALRQIKGLKRGSHYYLDSVGSDGRVSLIGNLNTYPMEAFAVVDRVIKTPSGVKSIANDN